MTPRVVRKPPAYETLVSFEFNGELINENKIVNGDEDSPGLSIKGDYPEEDGILASLFTATAAAARGTSVTEQSGELLRTNRMCEVRFIFPKRT